MSRPGLPRLPRQARGLLAPLVDRAVVGDAIGPHGEVFPGSGRGSGVEPEVSLLAEIGRGLATAQAAHEIPE